MLTPSGYTKFIAALAVVGLISVQTALSDNRVTVVEGLITLDALCVAGLVYIARNGATGLGRFTKTFIAGLGAGVAALIAAIGAGSIADVAADDWVSVLLAIGGAIGVFVLPNTDGAPAAVTVNVTGDAVLTEKYGDHEVGRPSPYEGPAHLS